MKIGVEFVVQSFDDTPEGVFQFQVLLAVAELEKGLIARRTMNGRYRKVREGKYLCSQAPYGYDRVDGRLVVNRGQARIVRRMYRWAEEGLGVKAIAERLNRQKIPPPNPSHPKRQSKHEWHFTTVYKILTNPRYKGENTYAGIPMPCPALVSEATFQAVGQALRRRRIDSPRNTRHFYLLQHRLYCRACGGRFRGRLIEHQYVYRPDGRLEKMPLPQPRKVYFCGTRDRYGKSAGHENVR